jgi:hypothetical protein
MGSYTSIPPMRLHGVVLSLNHTGATLSLPLPLPLKYNSGKSMINRRTELSGTHHFPAYDDDVNVLDENRNTTRKYRRSTRS